MSGGLNLRDRIYWRTEVGLILRAAERFGRDPFAWWDGLEAGQRLLILANERVRGEEDAMG